MNGGHYGGHSQKGVILSSIINRQTDRPYVVRCAPPVGRGQGRSCSCQSSPARQAGSPPTLQSADPMKRRVERNIMEVLKPYYTHRILKWSLHPW